MTTTIYVVRGNSPSTTITVKNTTTSGGIFPSALMRSAAGSAVSMAGVVSSSAFGRASGFARAQVIGSTSLAAKLRAVASGTSAMTGLASSSMLGKAVGAARVVLGALAPPVLTIFLVRGRGRPDDITVKNTTISGGSQFNSGMVAGTASSARSTMLGAGQMGASSMASAAARTVFAGVGTFAAKLKATATIRGRLFGATTWLISPAKTSLRMATALSLTAMSSIASTTAAQAIMQGAINVSARMRSRESAYLQGSMGGTVSAAARLASSSVRTSLSGIATASLRIMASVSARASMRGVSPVSARVLGGIASALARLLRRFVILVDPRYIIHYPSSARIIHYPYPLRTIEYPPG